MQISPTTLRVCPSWVEDVPAQEYNDIQRALDAVPAWGKYTILLEDNLALQHEFMLTNINTNITIDGQGVFGISFSTGQPMCTPGDRQTIKFKNLTNVRGETVIIRHDCTVGFYNIETIVTRILCIEGKRSRIYMKNIKLDGTYKFAPIEISNGDVRLDIRDSYLRGGYHSPALYFTSGSDNKVKIKDSVVLHYDVGNWPIQKSGDLTVGVSAYNCCGNASLCGEGITTHINVNNIVDTQIDY